VTTATKVAIKPLEDRIVVQPSDAEQTTASGLVIPDTAKEKPQEGTVLAVGPGRFEDGARVPLDVSVGDTVIYSKYGGTEVKHNGEDYLVLSARDVLAVIEKQHHRGREAPPTPPRAAWLCSPGSRGAVYSAPHPSGRRTSGTWPRPCSSTTRPAAPWSAV
jgi:chaperonin GroES